MGAQSNEIVIFFSDAAASRNESKPAHIILWESRVSTSNCSTADRIFF